MTTSFMRRCLASAALLACLGLAACSGGEKKVEPVVTVQVAPVEKTTLERTITSDAILFPLHGAAITPKVSAPVKKFYVQRGAKVKAGQLLAVLENRDLAAAEMQSKGDYEQAQATYATTTAATLPEDLQKAELEVNATRQEYEAEEKIYEARQNLFTQGAIPRKDLDAARVQATQAKNAFDIAEKHYQALQAVGRQQTLKSAQGQLTSAQGKYENSQAQLSYTEIRSPIDGVVTDRPLFAGEMASTSAPMITVMDTSQVVARAHIPQEQAALLKVGDAATISAPGVDEKVPAKVTIVSPALDPNSTTVEVWVQADNRAQKLRPGSTVSVTMVAAKVADALVIPATSVLTAEDGSTTVMVAGSDNVAHETKVAVGFKEGDRVQITSGLSAGQQVVTTGAYGLPDKTKITIAKPGAGEHAKSEGGKKDDKDKD
jgi:HlyD family secretion protein